MPARACSFEAIFTVPVLFGLSKNFFLLVRE